MKLRPLMLDVVLKQAITQVEQYARFHEYVPGITGIPGHNPKHCITTQFGYRIVFSYTRTAQGLFRDISISVDEKGKFPNEVAAYTLAQWFGFANWDGVTIVPPPRTWEISRDVDCDAVRIVERLGE